MVGVTPARHQLQIDLDGNRPPGQPELIEEPGDGHGLRGLQRLVVDDDFHARELPYLLPGAMTAVRAGQTGGISMICPLIVLPALMAFLSQKKL